MHVWNLGGRGMGGGEELFFSRRCAVWSLHLGRGLGFGAVRPADTGVRERDCRERRSGGGGGEGKHPSRTGSCQGRLS